MIEADQLALELVTDCGFIRAFWASLRDYRSAGSNISQREIFERLNAHFEDVFGEPRFSSYDAFKKCMRRKGNECGR